MGACDDSQAQEVTSDELDGAAVALGELLSPARECLSQAYAGLLAGGLAVGSALADRTGSVVEAARNRAYDPSGGSERLQGTPLAHAEMNVLAAVPTARDLSSDTLWSTQQPCAMCDAAAAFTGVGTVRWLAPDPWARASGADERREDRQVRRIGPQDERWAVVANVLFVVSVALRRGVDHPTVRTHHGAEPEAHELVRQLMRGDGAAARARGPFVTFLDEIWPDIGNAATAQAARVSTQENQ